VSYLRQPRLLNNPILIRTAAPSTGGHHFTLTTHRFAKEVHIRSGLVKKLLQRDANVGGHGGFLLPCCCCSNTHGTRSWPLASREQPPSGIYTTTWDSSTAGVSSLPMRDGNKGRGGSRHRCTRCFEPTYEG